MSEAGTTHLQACLDRLRSGDSAAEEELIRHSEERLKALTRRMLRDYPRVHRWEETDDVCQQAVLRLVKALRTIHVSTVADYARLASWHIRHVLIDLARHYYGKEGLGANYATPAAHPTERSGEGQAEAVAGSSDSPERNIAWADWHEQIEQLPDEERAVVDLLWYQGMKQDEAASALNISLSTLQRRWQAARIRLARIFDGETPG
jgi:RNA polymerase sigma-70 factor (ECF subfamily)